MTRKVSFAVMLAVLLCALASAAVAETVWCDTGTCGSEAGAAFPDISVLRGEASGHLTLYNPRRNAVLPPDMASPLFDWDGADHTSLFAVFSDAENMVAAVVNAQPWAPDGSTWQAVRETFGHRPFTARLVKVHGGSAVAAASIPLSISPDAFDAKVVFMQIPLPFLYAQHNPQLIRWRMADIGSYSEPETVLTDLPYCANCHAFSRDGTVFGLDIDYRKDKGGYILKDVSADMELASGDVFSWSAYRPEEKTRGVKTMGLFSKISPDGRKVMGTVKERSFFFAIDDVDYSQLFYPIRGHLAWYSRDDGAVHPLPGADSREFVQTGPAWSPDGKTVAFSRAPVPMHLVELIGDQKFLLPGEDLIEDLNEKYPMTFDIWTVPFNDGQGGAPVPLTGASDNGKSNFFPRYSPDGRWVVYVQSDTGLVMQPSSKLFIVPSGGGEARALESNMENMNSWHSFTPNGRWLVFSSKEDSAYTSVYATHIDPDGNSTPAVLLHRLSSPDFASIIPEAVPASIRLRKMALVEP